MAGKKKNDAFQAEVLTHLEYIREKQDAHDKKIEDLSTKIDQVHGRITNQVGSCSVKFEELNKRVAKTEGIAKGSAAVGGGGGVIAVFLYIWRLIRNL